MFIGMLNQVGSWTKRKTVLTSELRALAKEGTHFSWNDSLEKEFQELKKEVANLKKLSPFTHGVPLEVYTDASKEGLGYILMQESKEEDGREKGARNIIQMGST